MWLLVMIQLCHCVSSIVMYFIIFSCYGRVFTLSGHVVEGVTIQVSTRGVSSHLIDVLQVVSTGDHVCPEFHEETVTDHKGVYRLRGLSVSLRVACTQEGGRSVNFFLSPPF